MELFSLRHEPSLFVDCALRFLLRFRHCGRHRKGLTISLPFSVESIAFETIQIALKKELPLQYLIGNVVELSALHLLEGLRNPSHILQMLLLLSLRLPQVLA